MQTEATLGVLPGTNAEEWYAVTWDPREDFQPRDGDIGCEYLREVADGVQVRRHPEAMLRDSPHLWDVVSKWRAGLPRELARADYDNLTNFEIECWLTMAAAHSREVDRRLKRGGEA